MLYIFSSAFIWQYQTSSCFQNHKLYFSFDAKALVFIANINITREKVVHINIWTSPKSVGFFYQLRLQWLLRILIRACIQISWLIGVVLWHSISCRLFNAKPRLYIYIYIHIHTHWTGYFWGNIIFKQVRAYLFAHRRFQALIQNTSNWNLHQSFVCTQLKIISSVVNY